MALQLKPAESLPKAIKRMARKQLDDALEQLAGEAGSSRAEAVHEARKSFKKVRAVLRLVRPEIGEAVYHEENYCLRDAARPLTEVRDAKILLETLQHLTEHFGDQLAGRSFEDVRKALQANERAVRKRVLDEQDALPVVAAAARKARGQAKQWAAQVRNRWSALGAGLKQVYRRASGACADALADPTVEKLHEWRKQTKYLRYQLEILEPIWPEIMKDLADQADRLGSLLGDNHDLAVLRQKLTEDPEHFGNEGTREVLLALIDRRRTELEEEAAPLGKRLFRDRPKDLVRRLKGYWKTWRAEKRPAQPASAGSPA
jgi:CHAD domain-containing protein